MNTRTLKTAGWLLGGVAALFIAVQFVQGEAQCKAISTPSAHVELNGGVGPAGPAPHLW
jgi:hypothetical protein